MEQVITKVTAGNPQWDVQRAQRLGTVTLIVIQRRWRCTTALEALSNFPLSRPTRTAGRSGMATGCGFLRCNYSFLLSSTSTWITILPN